MDWTIKRGDIYYIERDEPEIGSEQRAGRPAIIVSNNAQNSTSDVVQVVYLTTKPKTDLPTHVTIRSTDKVSIALCEQITPVDISRLGTYKCSCNESEMAAIDTALITSLALDLCFKQPTPTSTPTIITDSSALSKAVTEAAIWKEMYNNLLNKILERG